MNAKLQIDYTGFARLSAICSQDSGLKRVLSELEQQRVHVFEGNVKISVALGTCKYDSPRDENEDRDFWFFHAENNAGENLGLVLCSQLLEFVVEGVEAYGKIDAARCEHVVHAEIHHGRLRMPHTLDETRVFLGRSQCLVLALCACDDHFPGFENKSTGLGFTEADGNCREALGIILSVAHPHCNAFKIDSSAKVNR